MAAAGASAATQSLAGGALASADALKPAWQLVLHPPAHSATIGCARAHRAAQHQRIIICAVSRQPPGPPLPPSDSGDNSEQGTLSTVSTPASGHACEAVRKAGALRGCDPAQPCALAGFCVSQGQGYTAQACHGRLVTPQGSVSGLTSRFSAARSRPSCLSVPCGWWVGCARAGLPSLTLRRLWCRNTRTMGTCTWGTGIFSGLLQRRPCLLRRY